MTNLRALVKDLIEKELEYQSQIDNGWIISDRRKAEQDLKNARKRFNEEMLRVEKNVR